MIKDNDIIHFKYIDANIIQYNRTV